MEVNILQNIQAAKAGDKQAFALLYKEFYTPLMRFVSYRVYDNEKAQDIVSDVFLKWYESLSRYEVKQKPLNYLYMIATRLIINESQKKKAEYFKDDVEEFLEDDSISAEEILNTEIDISRIKKIINEELSELEKSVILLKYIEEKENSEIALILEIKENYLRQVEHRGLKKIKKKVEEKYNKNI